MSFKFTKAIYKDIFSYFKYERVLSLCQKSKRFQKYIDSSLLEYKLFFYLSKLRKLYLFKAQNIQLIYELLIQYNDNSLESINKVFDFYIKEKVIDIDKDIKVKPFFPHSKEFMKLNCIETMNLYIYSLDYDNDFSYLMNKKVKNIKINTATAQNFYEISKQNENLNKLLSMNEYENIKIVQLLKGVWNNNTYYAINFTNLISLKLYYFKLNNDELSLFLNYLSTTGPYSNLSIIELVSMGLTDTCCDILGKVFKTTFPNIETISLQGNKITVTGLEELISHIKFLSKLRTIDFTLNLFGINGYTIIEKNSQYFQKLEEIKMNNQTMDFSFKDEDLINAVSKFPNLKHIDFYEIKNLRQYTKNIFHPKFTYLRIIDPSKSISSYLSGLSNLKELSIVYSINIYEVLSQLSYDFCQSLTYLGIVYCESFNEKSLLMLKNFSNVQTLDLHQDNLSDEKILYLSKEVFPSLTKLKVLNLKNNNITGNIDNSFYNNLTQLIHLEKLDISHNILMGPQALSKVIKALNEKDIKIRYFNCESCNNIESNLDWSSFWENCAKCYNLEKLMLSFNNLNDDDISKFIELIGKYFKSLVFLDLSFNEDISETSITKIINKKEYLDNINRIMLPECDYLDEEMKQYYLQQSSTKFYFGK